METRGSQKREKIEETSLEVVRFSRGRMIAILRDKTTGLTEQWAANDDFAGYVVEINGIGYEFIKTLTDIGDYGKH